jgi:23S rRNA (guanine745-N1)-methyltransferase
LLDIGCGEGFFTAGIAKRLLATEVFGIDIAKVGVRMAARSSQLQQMNIAYAVASSYALPFLDHSMDVITRIYAPSKDEELARVLKPEGRLILVVPGDQHLLALRTQIYSEVRPHKAPVTPKGFRLVSSHQLCENLNVSAGEDTRALLDDSFCLAN